MSTSITEYIAGVTGEVTFILKDADGNIKKTVSYNLVVDTGFDVIVDSIFKTASRPATSHYIALGTGVTAADAGDVALQTELERLAGTYAHTPGTKTCTITKLFAAGVATGAITEAGLFNAASSGNMFDRVVFSVINKGAADTLTAIFTITFS
jgi:hypothetical protein